MQERLTNGRTRRESGEAIQKVGIALNADEYRTLRICSALAGQSYGQLVARLLKDERARLEKEEA